MNPDQTAPYVYNIVHQSTQQKTTVENSEKMADLCFISFLYFDVYVLGGDASIS